MVADRKFTAVLRPGQTVTIVKALSTRGSIGLVSGGRICPMVRTADGNLVGKTNKKRTQSVSQPWRVSHSHFQ